MTASTPVVPVVVPDPRGPVVPLSGPPTFTVVIAAYQAGETIGRAIQSVLHQLSPAHEVLVVDDGSTDDIDSVLRPFGDRVLVIRRPHRGPGAARNAALERATGDFVVLLDADDAFHPARLQALGELGRARPDLDLLVTDMRFIVNGEERGTFFSHNAFALQNQRTAILRSCFVGGAPAARLSRLREVGGFDETLLSAEDWDCWLRLILNGSAAGLVNLPYYDYVLGEDSASSDRVATLWDRVRMLEKAARNPDLRPVERPVVAASLRAHASRAARAELRAALSTAGRRLDVLSLARRPMIGASPRALAIAALVAPDLVRRRLGDEVPPRMRLASAQAEPELPHEPAQ